MSGLGNQPRAGASSQDGNAPPAGFYCNSPSPRGTGGLGILVAVIAAVALVVLLAGGLGVGVYLRARSEAEAEQRRLLVEVEKARLREEEARLRADHQRREAEAEEEGKRARRMDDATREQLEFELNRAKADASIARASYPGAPAADRCEAACAKTFLQCDGGKPSRKCMDEYAACASKCRK